MSAKFHHSTFFAVAVLASGPPVGPGALPDSLLKQN